MSQVAIWFISKHGGVEALENLLELNINKEVCFSYFCICQQSIWDSDYKCDCIYPLNKAVEYMIDNCPELLKMLIPERKYNLIHALANSNSWKFSEYQTATLKIWLKSKPANRQISCLSNAIEA